MYLVDGFIDSYFFTSLFGKLLQTIDFPNSTTKLEKKPIANKCGMNQVLQCVGPKKTRFENFRFRDLRNDLTSFRSVKVEIYVAPLIWQQERCCFFDLGLAGGLPMWDEVPGVFFSPGNFL